ncbi:hypothetical protein C0989_000369 [Termitomyces sp. Mn162]|nr:hypothetical protein C0989_000369 [Termitomyces sp. Mn162]
MTKIRPGITITFEEAEAISQRVLELGRQLRRFGVCHSDVHVGNIILREKDNSPVLIDWGLASLPAAVPEEEKAPFYYEDTSVDINHDLRWKVKKGVKNRGMNDPYPAE